MVSLHMDFVSWHYSYGLKYYASRYIYSLQKISHYFSLPLLLPTLFYPWKRLAVSGGKSGFNLGRAFESFTFNFVSRFMGAFVRLGLFLIGSSFLLFVALAGALGFVVWALMPFMSISLFTESQKNPNLIARNIITEIKENPQRASEILFASEPGQFIARHLELSKGPILGHSLAATSLKEKTSPSSISELVPFLVRAGVWSNEFFYKNRLTQEDMKVAAHWWDTKNQASYSLGKSSSLGRSGIGRQLLYGYTSTLNQYTTDLSAPQEFTHHLVGRHNTVSRMERALTAGTGVVLVGRPGVGKKTVVLEFADRAAMGELGTHLAYHRVLEFDYNFLFSESQDLNQKKRQLQLILAEAEASGNVILVIRDLHRLTNPLVEGVDVTDVFEAVLEKRKMPIIALSTQADYERYLAQNEKIQKYFETIEIPQPSREEALEILLNAADTWERVKHITVSVPAIRRIIEGSDQYITNIPFPQKALELLDAVILYKDGHRGDLVTVDDVNTVLSEKTGISFAHLTESEKGRLANLENIIHERLVNQEEAVSLIAKILRSKSVGVISSKRPIGSFLFLGPTGVGKTETARVLATVYFGDVNKILRFDMAEYAGREGIERLMGSVERSQPGKLTTDIKNHPASLLLLDEIEKAPPDVFNLLLAMLDEGSITDAFGTKISCRNLFIIATSNAGAEFIRELVTHGGGGERLQKKTIEYVLERGLFSPELLNRFDGVVVYEPLTQKHLEKVARIQFEELVKNLAPRGVLLSATNEALDMIAKQGYDPTFGARPMRRLIELSLGDMLGKAILSGEVAEGDSVEVGALSGPPYFTWTKKNSSPSV